MQKDRETREKEDIKNERERQKYREMRGRDERCETQNK